MTRHRVIISILATLGVSAVVMSLVMGEPTETPPVPSSDRAAGALLYAENCASCHGADLEGADDWRGRDADGRLNPPPHDASGHTWHHTDTQIFTYTKLGGAGAMAKSGVNDFNSGMPAFEDVLTDEEIWAVLNFIKSTWPQKIRDAQSEMSRENSD
jgi:mono/diheme cytochrome c family protein